MLLPWVVLALLIASGSFLGGALMISRTARRDLQQHVDLVASTVGIRRPWQMEGSSDLARIVGNAIRDFFTAGMPHRWGVHTNPLVMLAFSLASFAAAWAFLHLLLHFVPVLSVPLSLVVGYCVPALLVRVEQSTADRKFLELFPDAVEMIVRMLRAGLPVPATMRAVASESGAPVAEVFKTIADRIDIGIPFEEALRLASEQVGLGDFRFFAAAVSLQRTTGGNLAMTLDILCDIVRKRRAVRLKARAATAEVRISAYVLGALPFLVVGALLVVAPQYLTPLVKDPRGNLIVATALIMLLMAFLVMREMMRRATRL